MFCPSIAPRAGFNCIQADLKDGALQKVGYQSKVGQNNNHSLSRVYGGIHSPERSSQVKPNYYTSVGG